MVHPNYKDLTFVDYSRIYELLDLKVANEMSTNEVEVLFVWLGTNYKSECFGGMSAICKFKTPINYNGKDLEFFELTANIHRPRQGSSKLSNDFTNLYILKPITFSDGEVYMQREDRRDYDGFASKAFWDYTPTKTLEGNDLTIRLLMEQIVKVSRKRNFIKEIKKYDYQHLKYFGKL